MAREKSKSKKIKEAQVAKFHFCYCDKNTLSKRLDEKRFIWLTVSGNRLSFWRKSREEFKQLAKSHSQSTIVISQNTLDTCLLTSVLYLIRVRAQPRE